MLFFEVFNALFFGLLLPYDITELVTDFGVSAIVDALVVEGMFLL